MNSNPSADGSDGLGESEGKGESRDSMAPPEVPCECSCLHCGRTFMSDGMWFQRVLNDPQGFPGFWMCPTPNCGGAGFTFDIFPTDPDHLDNASWTYCDEDEEAWDEADEGEDQPEREYDPAEPGYKMLDELFGDADDDLEGEEWKHGLQPGERPEPSYEPSPEAMAAWEEQEASYDGPDERPREVDWSNHRQSTELNCRPSDSDGDFEEDDIPY